MTTMILEAQTAEKRITNLLVTMALKVEEAVDQAIRMKVPVIWMQEGVVNEKAAQKARQAGIFVVMDRCILKEHRARFG